MRALISIPVHEKPDVIKNQIENIHYYFPEALIVLHVSASYFEKYSIEDIEGLDGVYLNPKHMVTNWGDIVLPHVSNYFYIESLKMDYDYFVMHSSNDMFVCKGVADYIQQYDAGFNIRYMRQKHTYWWPCAMAWEDPWIKSVMNACGQTKIVASQVEGSFYKKTVIDKVMNTIQKTIDNGDEELKRGHYTREEFFFSTVAETLVSYDRVGYPYVFSEVHRFDRELWHTFMTMDRIYKKIGRFIITRHFYDRIKGKYNHIKFTKGKYKTSPTIVDRIVSRDERYVTSCRFLNDGAGTVALYGKADTLFAVKRVERDINNPLRQYISTLK